MKNVVLTENTGRVLSGRSGENLTTATATSALSFASFVTTTIAFTPTSSEHNKTPT